jgi:hypothetical protein
MKAGKTIVSGSKLPSFQSVAIFPQHLPVEQKNFCGLLPHVPVEACRDAYNPP